MGGCNGGRPDGVDVDAGGEAIELRPYNVVRLPLQEVCPRPLFTDRRTVTVTFAAPGRRLLRAVGEGPTVVERVVVVEEP